MRVDVNDLRFWRPEWIGTRVFLDGKEIFKAFYADDEEGVIKTFDVMRDRPDYDPLVAAWTTRRADGTWWTQDDFPGREVEAPLNGALTETLRGKVEILLPCEK